MRCNYDFYQWKRRKNFVSSDKPIIMQQNKRKDEATRLIQASPAKIYRAFIDPVSVATWRPPASMRCEIFRFEPWQGGTYRMAYRYAEPTHAVKGKTDDHTDILNGRFVQLVRDHKIVEAVRFESADPQFSGEMILTTTLENTGDGTLVHVVAEQVPDGINPDDHIEGIRQSLSNLEQFVQPKESFIPLQSAV